MKCYRLTEGLVAEDLALLFSVELGQDRIGGCHPTPRGTAQGKDEGDEVEGRPLGPGEAEDDDTGDGGHGQASQSDQQGVGISLGKT